MRGTVRTFRREVQDLIESRLRAIVAGVAATFDMSATVRYERRYPATVNTAEETGHAVRAMCAVVGETQVDTDPLPEMGSEDFAFMLEAKRGCYVWMGTGVGENDRARPQPALRLQRRCAADRRVLLGHARGAAAAGACRCMTRQPGRVIAAGSIQRS